MPSKPKKTAFAMSKRRRSVIFILCLLVAAVIVWLDRSQVILRRQARFKSPEQTKAYDFGKYHDKTFSVVNVVDGDTIDINVPDGEYEHTRIRLWGVDAPETKSSKAGVMYFGPEAADFTNKTVLGKKVSVYLGKHRTRGKFGRLLAYVKLPDGRFLNEVLLIEGFAYADLRFEHDFYNKYKQLEASARRGKKGLWGNVSREQLPGWLQRERPEMLDK